MISAAQSGQNRSRCTSPSGPIMLGANQSWAAGPYADFEITIRAACFASRAASRFPSHADTIEPQHDRMTNADRVLQEAVPHSVRVEANQEQYIRTVNTVRKTREI